MRTLALSILLTAAMPLMAAAQISIGVNLLGLTYHLQPQQNADLYRYRFDAGGRMVAISGVQLSIDIPLYSAEDALQQGVLEDHYLGLQLAVALFRDCALQPAGYFHFGARGFARTERHGFGLSFGPAWFARRSWSRLPGYADEGLFADNGRLQHSFYWHGGGLEHVYYAVDGPALSTHFIPGIPEILVVSGGVRLGEQVQ
ncbi:hypothetical protein [Spirochaeta africana]|uniref:YjbH domain-containing protein n=1 Tax=Spirochaeta africana (strain ATCC 700263 / DSM 8902 / Z-7692) TaxID=889378 RepID=H9UJX1_SPIAZ|nr:hypothetical protein [Spirochaeta africana]AFG37814.1 hypothetical protein Spiaf_1757 [Spirochaeta africana DSM 8902]